jgi:hypothetical protein
LRVPAAAAVAATSLSKQAVPKQTCLITRERWTPPPPTLAWHLGPTTRSAPAITCSAAAAAPAITAAAPAVGTYL